MEKCKWLNTDYGEGCYICMGMLKPIGDDKICETCPYNTEKEDNKK